MTEAVRVAGSSPAKTADLLIFTAGIFAAPQRQETPERVERDLAVSYLNRFVAMDFRRSARRAIEAGADGVEIQGAYACLIQQFFAALA